MSPSHERRPLTRFGIYTIVHRLITMIKLAARRLQDFERDLTQSNTLDFDGWRSRPLTEKGRDWLWSYFGEVF